MILFVVQDRTQRWIRLTQHQWEHISEHAEMTNQLERIRETVEAPHKVIISSYDSRVRYFFRHYKNTPTKSNFLMVSVRYLNGEGFIITAFYSKKATI